MRKSRVTDHLITMTEMMNNTTAEAEYTRCKTSVWWDIENCAVPKGCDAHGITQKLSTALANMNYLGSLSISSYGNTDLIPKAVQHALSSTGISLNHVPPGRKDASDKKILVDMFLWVVENPPPANIMLITGDIDFSHALHRLRMRRYNILLAHPQNISPSLVASATTSWLWRSLLLPSGTSLTQCESSRVLESSEISSEEVFSTQPMDSGSGSSRAARSRFKGIYVSKASNQLMAKEALVDAKNVEESGQNKNKESLKCLEKQNKELMEETITTSETVSTQNEIVIEELQGMLKQGLHIKSGEPENAHAGPSVNLEEDMNKKKKKNRQNKKSRVVEDKAEPYVCSICSVICDSPAIFESHLNGRKHADMIDKYSEALLDDKQIQEDIIIIQDNGHSIDGEAPENMDYFNKQSQAFEDVIENGYKSIPNEDKAEPEAYVCSVCSVICVCPIVFESHLMGRRHASRVKKHEEVLFDDKKILEESLKEKDHPRNKQESIKEVSQRSKEGVENEIEQEPKKARERLDSVVKRFELSLEDTSEQTVVEAGSASELAEESGTQIRVCDWCSVTCTSQMDFDSHLTGKKHAASVKKQVAVVKKQAGTKFAYVRKNGP